jgi:hypothetical protein
MRVPEPEVFHGALVPRDIYSSLRSRWCGAVLGGYRLVVLTRR